MTPTTVYGMVMVGLLPLPESDGATDPLPTLR